jgi:tetratricopeptide (TPR) repeat protein
LYYLNTGRCGIFILNNTRLQAQSQKHAPLISVRSPRVGYLAAFAVTMFFAAYSYYLEYYIASAMIAAAAIFIIPPVAFTDRINFDGKRIYRSGIGAFIWSFIDRSLNRLKIRDIEFIDTYPLRSIKRGSNVRYRYKTTIRGRGLEFSFVSGSEDYRSMVAEVFTRVSENVLDTRSVEIRDHLIDPKAAIRKAVFSKIPSADVLEDSFARFRKGRKSGANRRENGAIADAPEKVADLHDLGNELRTAGFLLQSFEAFRRALLFSPHDGELLLDFGRCLQSISVTQKSEKLHRRSVAALCLAERHANGDPDLLTRLGEAYFQLDEWRRAESVFRRVTEGMGDNFRALRGLAEIALREGKIAHVIHHFSSANRVAGTTALRRWSRAEADYFSRLNDDDEYMDLEIARVNLLETLEHSSATSLKIASLGLPTIIIGALFEDKLIMDIGWAVAAVALLIWSGLTISQRLFRSRIPFEIYENEK